jgi:hypothetical protein
MPAFLVVAEMVAVRFPISNAASAMNGLKVEPGG